MKKMKKRKQRGSTIIVCIVIMFFLSTIAIFNFNSSKNDLNMSSNLNIRNLKSQAAENGIKMSIQELFINETDVSKVLQLGSSDKIEYCSYNGSTKEENEDKSCNQYYMDANKTIKSYSKTTLNEDTECLAYGNSDKKTYCFIIKGYGDIPLLEGKPSIHVQEIQVNTININNNGIYEL